MFKNVISWVDGKKTYITIGLGFGVAVAQYFGYPIPWYVDTALGFAGLGFNRLAVAKQSKLALDVLNSLKDLAAVYTDIKTQVVIPQPLGVGIVVGSVTVGQPSPTQFSAQEVSETEALNSFQVKK